MLGIVAYALMLLMFGVGAVFIFITSCLCGRRSHRRRCWAA